MSTIGDNIKRRREELGMTQEELAHKIGYKSKASINKIEAGVQALVESKIIACARALDVTPSYLMGWTNKTETENYNKNDLEYLLEEDTEYMLRCIGSILKSKRIKLNLTEKSVSDKSGITLQEYLDIESGNINVGEDIIISVMNTLGIEFYYFIGLLTGFKITLKALQDNDMSKEDKETILNELLKQYY